MIDDLAHADDGLGIANLIGEGEKGEEGKGPKKPGEEEDEVNFILFLPTDGTTFLFSPYKINTMDTVHIVIQ